MLERIEGIITDIIKHTDKHNVVTLYTRSRGRMAFLVPIGKSKSGRMRNAAISPMAIVGGDVNVRPGKELYTLRQVQSIRLWHGIYSHPVKSALLFFLTEFCNRLVRQYPADEKLWVYLLHSLELLENLKTNRLANFHITFLIRLLPLAGIEPSATSWEDGEEFDMMTGEMTGRTNPSYIEKRTLLPPEESRHLPLLMRMNFRNMHHYKLKAQERRQLLEKLLQYYSIHLPLGGEFKTLPVLHELFA